MRSVLFAAVLVVMPSMARAQEAAPVPEVTDADRQAAFPDVHGHTVHDRAVTFKVLFDQLEWQSIHGKQGLRWDNSSWFGGDINRVCRNSQERLNSRERHAPPSPSS